MKRLTLLLLLCCCCYACQDRRCLYHQYRYIAHESWQQQDSLSFDIQVEPQLLARYEEGLPISYNLCIDQSQTAAYPYRNLMVAVMTQCDNGVHIDTLDLRPHDRQKENPSCLAPFVLSADRFPFRVVVYHLMQDEQLPHLQRLGLELTIP